MLSTIDNPFDPFEQFTSWLLFDKEKGYDSCERLARLLKLSDDLSQKEIDEATEKAIDDIIALDFTNTFIKVTKTTEESADEESVDTEE